MMYRNGLGVRMEGRRDVGMRKKSEVSRDVGMRVEGREIKR